MKSDQGTIKILIKSYLFLFRFDPLSYNKWGGLSPALGGGGARALPKRYKVTPLESRAVLDSS